jgi:CRP-like cAMP-binding protein
MISATPDRRLSDNRLLAMLPADDLARVRGELQPVRLEQGQILYDADRPIEFVYFVDEGMVSVVSVMQNGSSIEIAMIGNEGVAGWMAVLGVPSIAYRHTVQAAGRARRVAVASLLKMVHQDNGFRDSGFRGLLERYQAAFLTQAMQGVACNGLHTIEQRLCRWLLSTRDRTGSSELAITHDLLAQMLGVRRASVTDVLRPLQDDGVIRASRGKLTIVDADRLAAASCECYRIIRREYERMLGEK